MKRTWLLWLTFAFCLLVGAGAMAWISATVLRLDRAEAEARRQAHVEENVRLALWRMDSALAPLIAQETARPYFAYRAFTPAERAYTRMFNEIEYGEVLVPSPLLTPVSPAVKVHFQFDPDGDLTSPQAPTGNMRDVALGRGYSTRQRILAAEAALRELRQRVPAETLLAALPPDTTPLPEFAQHVADNNDVINVNPMAPLDPGVGQFPGRNNSYAAYDVQVAQDNVSIPNARDPSSSADSQQQQQQAPQQKVPEQRPPARQGPEQQIESTKERQDKRSRQEWQARSVRSQQASNFEFAGNRVRQVLLMPRPQRIREGVMRPLWLNGTLVLARRVSVEGQDYVQGCWLDWDAIRASLLAGVADLLPRAALVPAESASEEKQPRLLAALPVRLIPGPAAFDNGSAGGGGAAAAGGSGSPVRITLLIAWVSALVGSAAVGLLLWGAMRLSERRGAFVSAVTHELRTPLTTLSMYAEMLEGGMVPDAERRQQYLTTLRAEADRLGHLVENVLAYSRIERGTIEGRLRDVALGQVLAQAEPRLRQRLEQAGMTLDLSVAPDAADAIVRADPDAVEQVLFNLVDNATKYANGACAADDPARAAVHVEARRAGRVAEVLVRDHGPGIPAAEARRLFRPFCKSARDAANSAPGVGLGLALSRRLAREMRGDLVLVDLVDLVDPPAPGDEGGRGARFRLTLPVRPARPAAGAPEPAPEPAPARAPTAR